MKPQRKNKIRIFMFEFFAVVFLIGYLVPVSIAWTVGAFLNLATFSVSPFFGIVLLLPAVYLMYLGANELLVSGGSKLHPELYSKKIVTRGIYNKSRHPIYLGFLVGMFGIALIVGSWFLIFLCVVFVPVANWYVSKEEGRLVKQFGKAYVNYTKRVPKWIPRFA